MHPRGCLEAFVLASCVVWVAGQEVLTQPTRGTIQNNVIKLVSAELHPNMEGNLETRCVVLTFPDVPRQLQKSSNAEQPGTANTSLPEPSPKPSGKCPPFKSLKEVYDSESLFGAPTGAADVSLIREEAKSYFVAHNRERSFSNVQVLGMILAAMVAENEGIATGINFLKSQIQSGELAREEPQIVVVCFPDGIKEERVVDDCVENETGALGSKTSYAPPEITSIAPSFQKGDVQQNERRQVKTVMDILKGSTLTTPGNEARETYLPSRPTFVTGQEQFLSRSQPPPTPVDPPTKQSPPSEPPLTKNGPQPDAGQTAATLQLSVSGIIRAVLPLSISKMTAELSLSFAPFAQTSLIFPSTAKPTTSISPSFLKPPLRLSPKTKKSLSSTTTPTTAGSILPQTPAVFTTAPVYSSESHSEASASPTAAVASETTSVPLKNIFSLSSSVEPHHSAGSSSPSSVISPTVSQFSTQPNTMPESGPSSSGKQLARWVTSE